MKKKHNCDQLRLKKLLGIDIDVDKYNRYSSIHKMIMDSDNKSDVSKIESFLSRKNKYEINPNIIIFLKKCGFNLRKITRKNVLGGNSFYYDIVCDNQPIFNIEFPAQVFYTNKLLEALSQNEYFQQNYMEGDFIDLDLVKIEEEVENFSARYSQKKFLDFSIHSKFNKRCLIAIEINEFEHRAKQSEDEKRCEDLRARRNNQGYTIIGPFSLRINDSGNVTDEEFDKFVDDILSWIKLIDDCQNKEEFVVNFLVEHDVGDIVWSKILYKSYSEKKICFIPIEDIMLLFGNQKINKKINIKNDIIQKYKHYREDYIYRLKENIENDDDLTSDEKEKKIKEINLNFEEKNGKILLNYNGISNFLQFLFSNEEYFRYLQDHNSISNYFIKCQICMIDAIEKLFSMQQKMLNSTKTSYYYGSYE
jgi:hypothetical protein